MTDDKRVFLTSPCKRRVGQTFFNDDAFHMATFIGKLFTVKYLYAKISE